MRLQVVQTEPMAPRLEHLLYGPAAVKQYSIFQELTASPPSAFSTALEERLGLALLESACQTADGSYLLGIAMDYPGFDWKPDLAGIALVTEGMPRALPELRAARFARAWAGVLPFTTRQPAAHRPGARVRRPDHRGRPCVRERGRAHDRAARRGPDLRGRAGDRPDPVPPRSCGSRDHLRRERVVTTDSPVERRIAFVNPFGTAAFDEIIRETLVPYASTGTAVDVIHLEGVPANIDYYYPKHLMELAIFEEVRRLEAAGYDAVVVGCCYDPGVRVARELVDIPVVGPLEAAMNHASYVGHRFTIITDHRKALPWLEDLVRLHGAGNCRGVRAIDWYVTDMIQDTTSVANDAAAACMVALREDTSEVVILGCTIIGGCLEREIMTTGRHRDLPILNPNLLALKAAEIPRGPAPDGQVPDQPDRVLPAPRAARCGRGGRGATALAAWSMPAPRRPGQRRRGRGRGPRRDRDGRHRRHDRRARGPRLPGRRARRAVHDRRRRPDRPRDPRRARPRRPRPRGRTRRRHHRPPSPERGRTAGPGGGRDGRGGRRALRRQHLAVPHEREGGRPAGGSSRRLQRPLPRRRLAERRDDRGLRRDPSPRRAAGRAVARHQRSCGSPPRPARTSRDRRGTRTQGLAHRHLPQPGRGLGAARRRGLAAADRGNRRTASSSGSASRRTSARWRGRSRSPSATAAPWRSRAAPPPTALRRIVETTVDADNIGEIGIGLNPAARIGDDITEAKKAFGTVHIALGDSANEYGGLVECEVHLDGLVMEPTVEFDGVPVVVAGRHVYDVEP